MHHKCATLSEHERALLSRWLRYGTPLSVPLYTKKVPAGQVERFYIWRTQEDDKVRPSHAARNGMIFSIDDHPPGMGRPGEEANCRCKEEEINATFNEALEKYISLYEVSTWPRPPINGRLTVGEPSREKPKRKGEKRLYDMYGGEWRPHKDPRHNLHWDYRAKYNNAPWHNIPINGKPTETAKSIC